MDVLVNRGMKLSASMTLSQFENGYWYATQLKDFGETIGIPSASKLRKDELERAIRSFLVTGKAKNPTKRNLSASGIKDVERGLSLELEVVRYTNDEQTKAFLEREAQKCVPGLKRRSGVRYRFNRWREEQLVNGVCHSRRFHTAGTSIS
jgi:SAP domain-containing new25